MSTIFLKPARLVFLNLAQKNEICCSDTPRSSGWVRWKADNLLLKFKKNPDEKYFFVMEIFDFEKIIIFENFENIFENSFF